MCPTCDSMGDSMAKSDTPDSSCYFHYFHYNLTLRKIDIQMESQITTL